MVALTFEQREHNETNYYEQTLYEELVEYNAIKAELDILYKQHDWVGLTDYISVIDQDVLYHWDHYDVFYLWINTRILKC